MTCGYSSLRKPGWRPSRWGSPIINSPWYWFSAMVVSSTARGDLGHEAFWVDLAPAGWTVGAEPRPFPQVGVGFGQVRFRLPPLPFVPRDLLDNRFHLA